ncbi:MAG: redoxin domain-containing protein [Dehalococcoidia bacterium]|nr:redoxin domain-containing protein [Dehalococcoidia bacterium]
MKQVVDLEGSEQFKSLDIALVSIATDTLAELLQVQQAYGVTTPLLSDEGGRTSQAYGAMRWAHGGEPGHTFVLVGKDRSVRWIQDYGAAENGGRMYVPVNEFYQELRQLQ